MTARDDLLKLLIDNVKHAPEGEPFTLKSGAKSMWYLDCRPVVFGNPRLVGEAVLDTLNDTVWGTDEDAAPVVIEAVGGPELGAVPIATAMAIEMNCRSFAVRKKPKDHGVDESLVIGDLRKDDNTIIVEDVVTSSGSILHAVVEAQDAGATIFVAACLLYRGDLIDGKVPNKLALPNHVHATETPSVPFVHLFTPRDLGIHG